jgi:O-antigen ligase
VFALVGFWEYGARELLWNDEVIRSNDFHTYFRVNSLFWDPNVLGRYMAIVITALMAVLLWSRSSHFALWLGALCGVLWLGMVITFSQSSFAALLAGLAVLAALRWSLRWTVVVCVAGLIAAAGFVLAAGGSLKIDLSTGHKLNEDVSGRGNLISGGLDLFGDRPLWGYGAGSFSQAFQEHQTDGKAHVNESHTEPITIAAEQGLIGILAYLALLAASFATLLRGMRSAMPGLRGPPAAGPVPGGLSADLPGGSSAGGAARPIPLRAQALSTGGSGPAVTGPAAKSSVTGPAAERSGNAIPTARAAVLACFVALLIHTMAYAGFLEDPLTWALLSIGACLAVAAAPQKGSRPHRQGEEATPTPSARASA